MDFKLQLLKVYLENKVKEKEAISGVPIGTDTLQFKMLCNSDPGIISIFVGRTQPDEDKSSLVDVWFDFEKFTEKAGPNSWLEFNEYKKEFTSTILDLTDDNSVVNSPVGLDITGLSVINKKDYMTSAYQAHIVLQNGDKYPISDVDWSVQSNESGVLISKDVILGKGILDFSYLNLSTTIIIKAEFTLADGYILSKELPVVINVEAAAPTETHKLIINGPSSIASEGTGYFEAIIHTDYSDGTFTENIITNIALWSVSSISVGAIDNKGVFSANKVHANTEISVMATYVINGIILTASKPLTITNRVVESVEILGVSQVKEFKTAQYSYRINFTDGTSENSLPVSWSLLNTDKGTIDNNGLFTAPSVDLNNTQSIIVDVLFDEVAYRAEKQIEIVNVADPVMTITGLSTLVAGSSTTYTAKLEFEGQTYDVTPTWSVSSSFGRINASGYFTANNLIIDTTDVLTATLQYQGYNVVATKNISVTAKKVTPIKVTITGPVQINEGGQATYSAEVEMSNGTKKSIVPNWYSDNISHNISNSGVLTAGAVNLDTLIKITARYTENAVTAEASQNVLIKNDDEIWIPSSLEITGPTTVNESSQNNKYTANLIEISNKGNTKTTNNVKVEWFVSSYGTILTDGNFNAAPVNANSEAIISAIYNNGTNLPVQNSLKVTIVNVPLLQKLDANLTEVSVYGGYSSKISVYVTKLTGTFDVTNLTNTSYTFSDSVASITKSTGIVNTSVTTSTKNVTITITYTEAGETITKDITLEVKANLANTLTITPSASTIFEKENVQFSAKLMLSDGTSQNVNPLWKIETGNTFGTINSATGLFVSNEVTSDSVVTVSADYTGTETGGNTIGSNKATINITNIIPKSMILINDAKVYSVSENSSITLYPEVTLNNNTKIVPKTATYSLSLTDQNYATISTDANGVVTITPKSLIADRDITVNADYVDINAIGGKLTASRLINLKYVRDIVGLDLQIAAGPYFKNSKYKLTVKNKYDDGTVSTTAITTGLTWNDVSSFGSIANNEITFSIGGNTQFSITAYQGSLTSNTVIGTVSDVSVVDIIVIADKGTSIKRDTSTVLSASLKMSDGSTINVNALNPVTWKLLDSTGGTLVIETDYKATFTAAGLETDKTVYIEVKAADGFSKQVPIMIDGYPIPVNAIINGPSTVQSGSTTNDYSLTVTMSNSTTIVVSPTNTTYSAKFGHTYTGGSGSITQYGRHIAPTVTADENYTITAEFTDPVSGITLKNIVPFPVTVKAAAVLVPTLVEFVPISPATTIPTTVASGATADFRIKVTMSDSTFRYVSPTETTYAAESFWTTTISGGNVSSPKGRFNAVNTNFDLSGTVTASYALNGTTKSATTPLTVKAAIGTALSLTPNPISIYEGKKQIITATLNTGVGSGLVITPTRWVVASPLLGNVSIVNGEFTASSVNLDSTTDVTAYFTSEQTNNAEVSGTVKVTIKDIVPSTVLIYNPNNSLSVAENSILELRTKVTLNDGTLITDPTSVVYSITSGGTYATLTQNNGIATITGLTVTTNQTVGISATYTAPDGKTKTGTQNITVTNTGKVVVGLELDTTAVAPYYEGTSVTLRVREKYDDGSFNTPVTTGVTWDSYDTSVLSITGVTAQLLQITGDKTVSLVANYGGRKSNAFSLTVTDVVPASVAIKSSTGSFTVKRETSATFTAEITMNNNTKVMADATNPVTWTNNNVAGIGTLTVSGQSYVYNAAASDIDKSFTITATTANNKTITANVTLDGYPIPTSVVINTGGETVNSGSTYNYTATVTMSDNTTRTLNSTNTTGAAWSETFTNGSINATTGVFTAGTVTVDETKTINLSYTDPTSNITVTAPAFTVKIVAPVVNSVWEDAVYLGSVDYRSPNTEAEYTKWLTTVNAVDTSKKYINKIANGTALFSATSATTHRAADNSFLGRYVILYPKKYGFNAVRLDPATFGGTTLQGYFNGTNTQTDSTHVSHPSTGSAPYGDFGSLSPQEVTLTVNGSPMVFYVYRCTVTAAIPASGATITKTFGVSAP